MDTLGLQYPAQSAGPVPLAHDGYQHPGLLSVVLSVPADGTPEATARPLIPLPIISVPFERVGMDLVGPLLKSVWSKVPSDSGLFHLVPQGSPTKEITS